MSSPPDHSNTRQPSAFDRRRLGGLGYMIADASLFTYGLLSYLEAAQTGGDKTPGVGMMITGAGWGVGGAVLAKFGKESVEGQLEQVENRLHDYLRKEGVSLDAEALQKADQHEKRGLADKLTNFCYDHPTELLNGYYALAALGMLKSGFTKQDSGEIKAASFVIAGALAGIFLKEKSPKELEDAGMIDTLLHRKPLAISSGLFLANNVGSFESAYNEQQRVLKKEDPTAFDQKYLLKYLTAGLYVASNLAVGSGSKKAGGTEEDRIAGQQQLYQRIGDVLAAHPPEQRQELAQKTGEFLSTQKKLRLEDQTPEALAGKILAAVSGQPQRAESLNEQHQRQHADRVLDIKGFSVN